MDLAQRQGKALLAAVKDKGFTPRRKDVAALVGLLDTDDDFQHTDQQFQRAQGADEANAQPVDRKSVV